MVAVVIGEAYVQVKPDTAGFGRETESKVASIAKRAAAIFAGAFVLNKGADFLGGAIKQASDLGETISKVGVVFGPASAKVLAFGKDAATSMGQSREQALAAAGTFGNLLRSVGLAEEQSAKFSTSMVQLGTDLASFNNTDVSEAIDALRSGLVGETEPLKRFGVNLNEVTLKAKALELGLGDGKAVLDANAKAQAAYALIMEQTSLAQGDFERTSGGLANQQRILGATFTDLQAKIGEQLLPVVTKLTTWAAATLPGAFAAAQAGIGAFIAAVAPSLQEWGDKAREIFERLYPAILQVGNFISDHFQQILFGLGLLIGGLLGPITGTILTLGLLYAKFQVVRDGVQIVIGAFKDLVSWVSDQVPKISEIFDDVVKVVSFLWSTFGEFITRTAREAFALVQKIIETAVRVVKDVIEVVLDILTGRWGQAWNAAKDAVGAVMGLIKEAVQTALRIVIDQVLSAIEALLRLASHLPIVGGKFKGLADDVDRFRDRVNASLGGVETKAVAAANTVIGSVRAMEASMAVAAKLAASNTVANEAFRAGERAVENAGPKWFKAGQTLGKQLGAGAGAGVKATAKKVADEAAKAAEAAAKKAAERLSAVFSAIRAALGLSDARQDLAAALGEQAALGAEQASLPAQIAAAQARLAAAVADSRAATAEEQVAIEDARAALAEAEAKAAGGADVAAARAEAALRLAELQSKALEDQADRTDAIAKATRELADAQATLAGERGKEAEKQDPTRLRELDQKVTDQQAALVKLKGLDAAASAKAAAEQAAATAELRKAEAQYAGGAISAAALQVARNNLTRAIQAAGGPNEEAQSAAEELADLQARQRDIGNELTDVMKRITLATLSLAESQRGANDALKDWKDAAPSQLGIFKDIATQAGLTKDQIDGLIKSIGTLASAGVGTIRVAPFVAPNLQTAEQILGGAFTGGGGPTYQLQITGATLQPLDEEAIVEMQRRMGVMSPI